MDRPGARDMIGARDHGRRTTVNTLLRPRGRRWAAGHPWWADLDPASPGRGAVAGHPARASAGHRRRVGAGFVADPARSDAVGRGRLGRSPPTPTCAVRRRPGPGSRSLCVEARCAHTDYPARVPTAGGPGRDRGQHSGGGGGGGGGGGDAGEPPHDLGGVHAAASTRATWEDELKSALEAGAWRHAAAWSHCVKPRARVSSGPRSPPTAMSSVTGGRPSTELVAVPWLSGRPVWEVGWARPRLHRGCAPRHAGSPQLLLLRTADGVDS
jgi:hypothetical protein